MPDNKSSWTLYEYDEVGSTQDVAREFILSGDGAGKQFVVKANKQTKGRGRSGRGWTSLSGNLQTTLVLPLTFDVRFAANFSFLSAVALSSTVSGFCASEKIEHKWPNDVWVNDRKLAGILLEVYKNHLLIGVGVNIAKAPDGAIALSDFAAEVSPEQFLSAFLDHMDAYKDLMLREGFAPVREKWLSRARGIGGEITVRTLSETFHGVFDGIEQDGALRVLIEGTKTPRIVHSADVFFGKEEGPDAARY